LHVENLPRPQTYEAERRTMIIKLHFMFSMDCSFDDCFFIAGDQNLWSCDYHKGYSPKDQQFFEHTVEPLYNGHHWGPTFCPL